MNSTIHTLNIFSPTPRGILLTSSIVFVGVGAIVYHIVNCDAKFLETFEKIRPAMFTGFITAGSFLLSMKTFILAKAKEVFENDNYEKKYADARTKNPNIENKFTPMENLSKLLLYSVLLSYLTSTAQISFGLVLRDWTAALCLALSATTISVILAVWYVVKVIIDEWMEDIIQTEDKRLKK